MRAAKFVPIAWIAVIAVTVLRAIFAQTLPLTGDEAYYWEWSRRLAAGYVDHPPAVAFAIAAFSWLGHSAFAVRIAFVLCGLGTAWAAGAAASVLSGDRRAGAAAALAISLAPIANVGFGIATPDGPYAFAWAASLYLAARAFRERRTAWFALLGVALGAALLSRLFSFALVAGVAAAGFAPQYRGIWKRGLWLSMCVAALLFAPFVLWNAQHQWASFDFAIFSRHPGDETSLLRMPLLYLLDALAFSPGLWIAATVAALRVREPLVLWTAVPLCVALFVLSLHERVEVYWFLGPFISLCTALDVPRERRALVWGPAFALSALVFTAAIAPLPVYALAARAGLHLSDGGPFEMFTYPLLSSDVRRISERNDAAVMTDGYGFSSLLDFYGGVTPFVIGYDAQGAESLRWTSDADRPEKALFVDKVPLSRRADFTAQLRRACGRVETGPVLRYGVRRYFTTWCDRMSTHGLATLRWQKSKS